MKQRLLTFFSKPLNILYTITGLFFLATAVFAYFKPIKVVQRIAYIDSFALEDNTGTWVSDQNLRGRMILFGFGYINDPTKDLDQTLNDLRTYGQMAASHSPSIEVETALVLFDDQRDTLAERQAFADANGIDHWLILGGDEESLKLLIGYNFGIYYEKLPIEDLLDTVPEQVSPGEYGYIRTYRYVLLDEDGIIRGEYREPLDMRIAERDFLLMERERQSTGARRVLNEAAHTLNCYP